MKTAIVGSRCATAADYGLIGENLPPGTTEIISGGAQGVDQLARRYALEHGLPLREFLPDYRQFGKIAPILRNNTIVQQADFVLCLWDGRSPGTQNVISLCLKLGKPLRVVPLNR
ncbi:MAG TPA: DUF2493 domain-containing protein [Firmicutes bacterium]|nr:DUF2493 domain-containing protein [Bacillota bacterium]